MRRLALVIVVYALALSASSCRILTREVACYRDGDCPQDVGLGFCDVPEDSDGGPGVCVSEDPRPPTNDDGEDAAFPFLDAGPSDAGDDEG
jgi:hypothetical protein